VRDFGSSIAQQAGAVQLAEPGLARFGVEPPGLGDEVGASADRCEPALEDEAGAARLSDDLADHLAWDPRRSASAITSQRTA
jgi:hypothetical protein